MTARRILRETKRLLNQQSVVQTAPSTSDGGETLAGNGIYTTFQVVIPATAVGSVVTLYGRLESDAPWLTHETVSVSGLRVHLSTPYAMARVTTYAGTGGIDVWATRDVL